jgi:hypothetical protein
VCREFFAATITLLLLLESSKSLRPLLLHALSFLSLFAHSWSSLNFLPLLLHAFPFLVTFGMQRCSWSSLNLLPLLLPLLLHALPFLVTLCMWRCYLLQASPDFSTSLEMLKAIHTCPRFLGHISQLQGFTLQVCTKHRQRCDTLF